MKASVINELRILVCTLVFYMDGTTAGMDPGLEQADGPQWLHRKTEIVMRLESEFLMTSVCGTFHVKL